MCINQFMKVEVENSQFTVCATAPNYIVAYQQSGEGEGHNRKLSLFDEVFLSSIKSTSGRRVFCTSCEGKGVSHAGACRSKNVGTSNRKQGEIPCRRKIKVSWAMVIIPGLVGS